MRIRRRVRRPGSGALLIALVLATVGAMLPLAPQAAAQEDPPDPRPIPAPARVSITATGFEPADVTVVVGQTVEFTNDSGATQTVTATDGTFDSGDLAPGAGFSLAVGETGQFPFASTPAPALTGTVTVGQLELTGPSDAPVVDHLPELPFGEATDPDELEELGGLATSRTRILVGFAPDATVAEANAALAAADVKLVGTLPDLASVLVAVDDPGEGDLDPAVEAVATLRDQPGVDAAAHDLVVTTSVVPRSTEPGDAWT